MPASASLIQNSVRDAFTEKLLTALKKIRCGDPMDSSVQVGPVINEDAAKKIESQVQRIVEQGGEIFDGWTSQRNVL